MAGHNSLEGFKYFLIRNYEFGPYYFFTPWDFDKSWGFSENNILPLDYWLYNSSKNIGFLKWNLLIYRLLFPANDSLNRDFIGELKNRWSELRSRIWTTENLKSKILNLFNLMRLGLLRNNKYEPVDLIYDKTQTWIIERLKILDTINFEPFSIGYNSMEKIPVGINGKNCTNSRYLQWECRIPKNIIRVQYMINGTLNWTNLPLLRDFSIFCSKKLNDGYYNFSVRFSDNLINWTDQDSFITRIINSELPSIGIMSKNSIIRDNYVNCTIKLDYVFPSYRADYIKSKIKLRGLTAHKLPKKGYRIELSEKISLFGMRKDEDWLLFSMYLDFTRTRIKLSFDLWRSLLEKDPTAILPNTKYIILYLNGEFQGIYLLAEHNDRKLFYLEKSQNNTDSSFIFKATYSASFTNYSASTWEQVWPNLNEDIFIMDEILMELYSFIENSSDEVFFDPLNGIFSKFYKLNLMDFFLFNFFILHKDFWWKNFFLIRQTNPNKFFLSPWDFDGSFGQLGWTTYDSNQSDEYIITGAADNRSGHES